MPPPTSEQFSGIFICYRRDDSGGYARALCERLSAHFGDEQIFMDLDQIEPGEDFVHVIERAVGSCEVLLALIGRNWLASQDETGRRLDNSNDFVRVEIAAAFARDVRVIPVLVQGARVPRLQDLPEVLQPLARRQAFDLSDQRWRQDVERLVGTLERILTKQREARRAAEAAAEEERQRRELEEEARRKAEEERSREAEARRRAEEATVADTRTPDELSSGEKIPGAAPRPQSRRARLAVLSVLTLVIFVGGVLWLRPQPSVGINNANNSANAAPPQATPQASPTPDELAKSFREMVGGVELEMVLIPAGKFTMGSKDNKGAPDERPPREITMPNFYIGNSLVTRALYKAVMGTVPLAANKEDTDPVTKVSWGEANSFCQKLSQMTGRKYRLPSEAEWEYASVPTYGHTQYNLSMRLLYRLVYPGRVEKNTFAMSDEKYKEWCADRYHKSYDGAPNDGSAWESGISNARVVRSGRHWLIPASQISSRDKQAQDSRKDELSFRVVAAEPPFPRQEKPEGRQGPKRRDTKLGEERQKNSP